jgi:hypothetical protein
LAIPNYVQPFTARNRSSRKPGIRESRDLFGGMRGKTLEDLAQFGINPVSQFDTVPGNPAPDFKEAGVGFRREEMAPHGFCCLSHSAFFY